MTPAAREPCEQTGYRPERPLTELRNAARTMVGSEPTPDTGAYGRGLDRPSVQVADVSLLHVVMGATRPGLAHSPSPPATDPSPTDLAALRVRPRRGQGRGAPDPAGVDGGAAGHHHHRRSAGLGTSDTRASHIEGRATPDGFGTFLRPLSRPFGPPPTGTPSRSVRPLRRLGSTPRRTPRAPRRTPPPAPAARHWPGRRWSGRSRP